MLGVDKLDQLVSYYSFTHKSLKWWRKVFFWLVEVGVVNSYVIYKEQKLKKNNERPITHIAYQRSLINVLTEPLRSNHRRHYGPRVQPTEMRLQGKPHYLRKDEKRTDCTVCSDRNKGQCILHIFIVVHVVMILPCVQQCFKIYHTQKNYKNE